MKKCDIQIAVGTSTTTITIAHPGQEMDQILLAYLLLDAGMKNLKEVMFEEEPKESPPGETL